jgi:hypothetical protein
MRHESYGRRTTDVAVCLVIRAANAKDKTGLSRTRFLASVYRQQPQDHRVHRVIYASAPRLPCSEDNVMGIHFSALGLHCAQHLKMSVCINQICIAKLLRRFTFQYIYLTVKDKVGKEFQHGLIERPRRSLTEISM